MRPVLEGLCKYESLIDGTLCLEDLKMMHDALDVKNENEQRWMEYQKKQQKVR